MNTALRTVPTKLLAVFFLGIGIAITRASIDFVALWLITLSLGLILLDYPEHGKIASVSSQSIVWGSLALVQIALLITGHVGQAKQLRFADWVVAALLVLAGAVAVRMYFRLPMRWLTFSAIAVSMAGCIWTILQSWKPDIDVWIFNQDSIDALLSGANPYSTRYRNPYDHERFFGPGLVKDGWLQFGYPYPPLNLLLELPFKWALGDYRYGLAFAIAGVGVALWLLHKEPWRGWSSVLFVLTPTTFFVVRQGWTEPWFLLCAAAVALCVQRYPRAVPWALGFMFAAKQNSILLAPLVPLLPTVDRRVPTLVRTYLKIAVVVAAINVPFVNWNPDAFIRSVVLLQQRLSFRPDSLNFSAWSYSLGLGIPSAIWNIVSIGAAYLLIYLKQKHSQTDFFFASATVMFASLLFYRAAFCNYYWLIIGMLLLSAGATAREQGVGGHEFEMPIEGLKNATGAPTKAGA
jgi:hypothetical protein